MVRRGSQDVDHTFDLQTRLAEIEQQAEPKASRLEIVGALHPMCVVQCLDGLRLDQKHVLDQKSAKYSPTTASL
jgi:hypothetical protein